MLALGVAIALLLPAAPDPGHSYYWRWSDGSRQVARTFTQQEYGIASNLPGIIVTAEPAIPGQAVRLQFLRDGSWTTEGSARTNAKGIATIHIDPACGQTWCDSTFAYRLTIGSQTARLTVTYAPE